MICKQSSQPTSLRDPLVAEAGHLNLAMNISQKIDHHSKRKPPGASIAGKDIVY